MPTGKAAYLKALMVIALIAFSCGAASSAGSSAAGAFLKLPVSAGSLALGGNSAIMGDGVSALESNPALLGSLTQDEFQTSYGAHLDGYQFFNAAYGRKGKTFNSGFSLNRVAANDFEGRSADGAPTGSFGAADMLFSLNVSKSFDGFSAGVNAKYISSTIESESASALAFDAGIAVGGGEYAKYPGKLAIVVRNIGTGLKYMDKKENLPLTIAAAFSIPMSDAVTAGFNVSDSVYENILEAGFGVGIKVGGLLQLNGGVSREVGAGESSDSLPFKVNAGIGVRISSLLLNYGFSPMGELGNTQRLSVTLKFGDVR